MNLRLALLFLLAGFVSAGLVAEALINQAQADDVITPSIVTLTAEQRHSVVTKLEQGRGANEDIVSAYVMINTSEPVELNEFGRPISPTSGENLIRAILPSDPDTGVVTDIESAGDASHPDGTTQLEVVKVTTTKRRIIQLAHNELVRDVLGIQCCGSNTVEGFLTIDAGESRFIDSASIQASQKKEIDYRLQYYNEMSDELERNETTEVFVMLNLRDEYHDDFSEASEQRSDYEIQALISMFSADDIEFVDKSHYSFTIRATKSVIDELYQDDRIKFIRSVYQSTKDSKISFR